jgi:hypothetical protein
MSNKKDRFECVACNSRQLMIAQEVVMYTMVSSMKSAGSSPQGKRWLECSKCGSKQKYPFNRGKHGRS